MKHIIISAVAVVALTASNVALGVAFLETSTSLRRSHAREAQWKKQTEEAIAGWERALESGKAMLANFNECIAIKSPPR